jgi:uncharacterized membrane protein YqjE
MSDQNNGSRSATLVDMRDLKEPAELSTPELVRRAYAQVSTLVRDEVALAKAELAVKAKRAGAGAGLFGAAGMLAFFGVGALVTTAILALSLVWPAWLAALTVAVVLFAIAGVAVLIGRGRINAASPVYPTEAAQGISADLEAVKTAVQERGHRDVVR